MNTTLVRVLSGPFVTSYYTHGMNKTEIYVLVKVLEPQEDIYVGQSPFTGNERLTGIQPMLVERGVECIPQIGSETNAYWKRDYYHDSAPSGDRLIFMP